MTQTVTSTGTAETTQAGHAPGRKRDSSRDDALCQAALELLADVGYDRLTIDAVAARAGAGKATCYRRWAGKAELVVDAIGRMKAALELPDTGTLRGDMVELTCHFHDPEDAFRTEVQAGLVSGLVRDAKLREVFAEQFIAPRKAVFRTVFERAIERGEIAPVPNYELISDIVPSMAFHRMIMTGRAPDATFIQTILDQIVLPLVTAPNQSSTKSGTQSTAQSPTARPTKTRTLSS
ncbi:AcrR family transcriptional regulator [Catenulispora sp. GAS73]|uniref:TetR/AcrR family transcriptional regulator n=1 Tax=Catenulispora sp. GAS73 TaxID=3156269 RepID=UPI003519402F